MAIICKECLERNGLNDRIFKKSDYYDCDICGSICNETYETQDGMDIDSLEPKLTLEEKVDDLIERVKILEIP